LEKKIDRLEIELKKTKKTEPEEIVPERTKTTIKTRGK